jgi:hypothetical protein
VEPRKGALSLLSPLKAMGSKGGSMLRRLLNDERFQLYVATGLIIAALYARHVALTRYPLDFYWLVYPPGSNSPLARTAEGR